MTRSQSPKSAAATRWTPAKKYKVAGSAFLLIAFGMQMYHTKASDREKMKMQAAELDGRQHIKALGYENLYFSIKAATGQEDPSNLFGAALERSVGRTALVVTSDEPKDVKISRANAIIMAARNVHDLESFNAFMRFLQQEGDTAKSSEVDALIGASQKAEMLWWIYISIYVVGSICLLRSQYLE